MTHVEEATVAMFDDIYPLLQELNNPELTRDKWKRIFEYRWKSPDEQVGNVLVDKGRVVGFIGTMFSRRVIDGQEAALCNLSSWIVKDEYRSEGMRLLLPLLRLKDHTFTNLTLNVRVAEIMRRLGFKDLDTNVKLLFPVPWFSSVPEGDKPSIVSDLAQIKKVLASADQRILADHSQYGCGHIVIREDGDYCYVLFTRKYRGESYYKVPYAHLHYISNRKLFLKYLNRIKLNFLTEHKCFFLMVEERLIGKQPIPFSKVHTLKVPKMYKSQRLTSAQVDNLYTELVVLGL